MTLVHRLEQSVKVRHRVQPQARGVDRVHLRNARLAEMCRRPEPLLFGFLDQRLHDGRPVCAEFQAVDALSRGIANPRSRLFRSQNFNVLIFFAGTQSMVGVHSRCDDFVRRAARFFGQGELHARTRHATYRRDAVPHPELVRVLGLGRLGRTAGMRMHVDDARHDVSAMCVDLEGRIFRALVFIDVETRVTDRFDVDDAVAFDDDIDRADRRRAGAVDHHCATNDQAIVGARALVRPPIGSRDHARFVVLCGDRQRREA